MDSDVPVKSRMPSAIFRTIGSLYEPSKTLDLRKAFLCMANDLSHKLD
jgi:hypothetical protein